MANPLKGETEVKLEDGRTLLLVFDVNAWIDIGEELKMEFPEILAKLQDKKNPPGLKFQRTVMWGGLRKHHPELTMRDAGDVMVEAANALAEGLVNSLPQGEPEAEVEEEDEDAEATAEADAGPRLVAGAGTRS